MHDKSTYSYLQELSEMNYGNKNLSETAYTHYHSNRCGHLGH